MFYIVVTHLQIICHLPAKVLSTAQWDQNIYEVAFTFLHSFSERLAKVGYAGWMAAADTSRAAPNLTFARHQPFISQMLSFGQGGSIENIL